ncbi:MAG: DNA repair protein RecO [Terriglobia bacterium]
MKLSARRHRVPPGLMPLCETEAIVLRTYRLGEADRIVSLFTRQRGRLRAVAAGAQRPRSRYGGVLEPLTYVRLWLFERENRDLLRMNSAELIESFFAIQANFRVQLAAQYMSEASERFLPEREVNERAFRLLLAALRGLKSKGEIERPLLYFNYWLLRLAGLLPDLTRCAACGKPLKAKTAAYEVTSPGLFCCRKGTGTISAEALILAEKLRRFPLEAWLGSEEPANAVFEARQLFEAWVAGAAEGRLVTLEMLRKEQDP